jgi:hypothetical protein
VVRGFVDLGAGRVAASLPRSSRDARRSSAPGPAFFDMALLFCVDLGRVEDDVRVLAQTGRFVVLLVVVSRAPFLFTLEDGKMRAAGQRFGASPDSD